MAPPLAVVFSPLATTANGGRGGEAATVLKLRNVQGAPLMAARSFAHCAISAPSPLLFAPSCHRPAFSPRRLRPLKRPQPRFAWPLSASREGFNITTYATGYAVPVGGFF